MKKIEGLKFKDYTPTYEVMAQKIMAGEVKKGWELYDSRPVWRIKNLKTVIAELYKSGTVATCAHVKTPSYLKYHFGKNAEAVENFLKTWKIDDLKALEAIGLKPEWVLMVDAKKAHDAIKDEKVLKEFVHEPRKLARQIPA